MEGPAIGRRRFLNWFIGTSFGAMCVSVIYPVLRYVSPPNVPEAATNQVEAGAVNDPIFLDKGYKIVRFGPEPVILVKVSDTDFRAFSATCTHLDCIVEFRPQLGRLWCNCHNGQYDLTGRNVAGPPPRPLTRLVVHTVEQAGGTPLLVVARA